MTPPTELRVSKDRRTLTVSFADMSGSFSAELLRVLSPSAEVQGHSPDQRVTVGGKRNVAIAAVHPVGNYAVRIVFDDRHDSGIYTWSYFRDLIASQDERWQDYLAELSQKGLTRG
jgi:DUF971 family protein